VTGPDSRPFGKATGWVAGGVIALGALPAPLVAGPLVRPLSGLTSSPFTSGERTDPVLLLAYAFYAVALFAILGAVAYGVRRASYSGGEREWDTLRALGQERSALVKEQARRGEVVGVKSAAVAVVAEATASELWALWGSLSIADGTGGGFRFDPWTLVLGALAIAMAAAATAGVFALVARHLTAERAPRQLTIPVTVAEGNPYSANRRALGRWARRFAWAVLAASAGYQTWLWFHPTRFVPSPDGVLLDTGSSWVDYLTRIVALLGILAIAAFATTRTSLALTTLLGRFWSRRNHSLFAVAGDGLSRRSVERTFAAATMAVVLGITAYAVAASSIDDAKANAVSDLDPDYTITLRSAMAPGVAPDHYPGGYSPNVLPTALIDALQSDPRVTVVPVGILYADPIYLTYPWWTAVDENGTTTETHWYQDSYAVFDPSLTGESRHDEWIALGLGHASVLHSTNHFLSAESDGPGAAVLTVAGERFDTFRVDGPTRVTAIDAAWAVPHFGAPPVNALMFYLTHPTGLTADARQREVATIVADATPAGTPLSITSGGYLREVTGWATTGISAGGTMVVLLGVVLGVALTGVLAAASARSRRRDLATIAALGARQWTLRGAPAVEAGATALVAAVVGTAAGAGAAILLAHPTLFHPGGPFDPLTTPGILWWNTTHVFWPYSLTLIAVATVLSALVGLNYGTSAVLRTPVDALREAIKDGAP